MSETKFSNFTNEDGSTGPDLVGITSFTSPYYFVPPSGNTAQRPSGEGLAPGMLRFNTDIGRLEVWRADHWGTILGESPNLGISTNPAGTSGGLGTRGVFAGGNTTPGNTNTIDYVTISTTGNAIDFGDLYTNTGNASNSCASSTRGITGGGYPTSNVIQYITISSTGNSQDFGDLTQTRYYLSSLSNATRGIFGGGVTNPAGTNFNIIDYITIASTGDARDFGDLISTLRQKAALSSSTRGIFAGGSPGLQNTIYFVTISTTGNASDFGDLTVARDSLAGCSNSTRGVIGGGQTPSFVNTIDYVTIASTGDAVDFGDLSFARNSPSACSNGHGGL